MTRPTIAHPPSGAFGLLWHNLTADIDLSPGQRTCMAAASHLADLVTLPHNPVDDPAAGLSARTEGWYRVAVSAFNHLNDTGAYRLLDRPPPGAPQVCRVDEQQVRAWLTSAAPGDEELTVAEQLGIGQTWDVDDVDLMSVTENLVRRSQEAGVFGVPGYTIHAHPVADVDTYTDAHIITLRGAEGYALASHPIPPEHLVDGGLTGIDAALGVLANTAVAVNELRQD